MKNKLEQKQKLKYIFSDFDGTLTENGELSKSFHDVLALVKKKNITFTIVSGRSASWGHFFLTHFPINYAVMEAGGVLVYKDKNQIKTKILATEQSLKKLAKITEDLLKQFPKLNMAADNIGRITDQAIELDSFKSKITLKKVECFLQQNRCHYSISNVHLNFSTIENSKWTGVQFLTNQLWKKKISTILPQSCFFGDAPNDEIMFENFSNSVGVQNIKPYLGRMNFHPSIITSKPEVMGVLQFLNDAAIL